MFTKPTTKNIASVAVQAGSFVVGAKIGDGIAAVVPDSMNSYKRYLIAAAGLLAAACMNPKTTMGIAGQTALVGAGAKQLYDELSEALADAIPVTAGSSTTNKFVNAVVGHTITPVFSDPTVQVGAGSPWLGNPNDLWERPTYEEPKQIGFTGV